MNGKHQWVVMTVYGLTDAEARATSEGFAQRLDAEHRITVDGPGCYNCELVWTEEVAAKPCASAWVRIERTHDRVQQA